MDNDTMEFFETWLKTYYKKLFPVEKFCDWLSYNTKKSDILIRREFSFTLAADIYLRYQSFQDANELRKDLIKTCPHKMDIGAVYSASPRIHRSIISSAYKPLWKELVFDIDLTDYDDIRFCCGSKSSSNSALCRLCWQLAQSAVFALDRALRQDFGFTKLLWVYSGRRGVHCWVCDELARNLDSTNRTAVAEYLSIVRPADARKNVNKFLHPSVDSAYQLLYPRFLQYIKSKGGQNLFARQEGIEYLLKLMPSTMSEEIETLKQEFMSDSSKNDKLTDDTSLRRWKTLKTFLEKQGKENLVKKIVLQFSYPRLDIHVSTEINHLLKSPFCVHPKTGYICVPFDPSNCEDFFPDQVPTLSKVIKELDQNQESVDNHLLIYKKTSLKPYMELFEKFVNGLIPINENNDSCNKSDILAF